MIVEYPWDTNWAVKCYILTISWSVFKARLIRERNLCSLIMHLVSSWTWISFYERSRRCPWMTLAALYVPQPAFAWFNWNLARLSSASPDVIYGRTVAWIDQLDTKCRIWSYVILLLSLFLSFSFSLSATITNHNHHRLVTINQIKSQMISNLIRIMHLCEFARSRTCLIYITTNWHLHYHQTVKCASAKRRICQNNYIFR